MTIDEAQEHLKRYRSCGHLHMQAMFAFAQEVERLRAISSLAVSLLQRPLDPQGKSRMAWNTQGYWIDGVLRSADIAEAIRLAAEAAGGSPSP